MRKALVALVVLCAACTASPSEPSAAAAPDDDPSPRADAATTPGADAGVDAAAPPASYVTGSLPSKWNDGTACASAPALETWDYEPATRIFRQSLCTHFEAPFLYLLRGETRSLLVDTGTGAVDVRAAVDGALEGHAPELVVAHSHSHGDHVGGDAGFGGRPSTTVVGRTPSAVRATFGIGTSSIGSIDLGNRVVDVIAIPGHEAAHVAFYDRRTRLLFTGDTLYPGRLYVQDFTAYKASVARLVAFVDAGHPVVHVLGGHIELSATGAEHPAGSRTHPGERVLELGEPHLRDLLDTVNAQGATPARTKRDGYVLVPL